MKVLIADDHALIRSGLRQICTELGWTFEEVATGEDALRVWQSGRPDLLILDLNLPGLSGLNLLSRLLEYDFEANILVLSMHRASSYASRALQIGAKGYVSKNASPDELKMAMQRVAKGGSYVEGDIAQQLATQPKGRIELTERDLEILRLLGEGRNFNEIAVALTVSYKTVANSAALLKSKLGVPRTADLIRLSLEMRMARGA